MSTAPRPNLRRVHPLDAHEQAMITDPPETSKHYGPSRIIGWLIVGVIGFMFLVFGVIGLLIWVLKR